MVDRLALLIREFRMNVCLIGHGMMGTWHSNGMKNNGWVLHTVVGVIQADVESFSREHGYLNASIDYRAAIECPEVEVVLIAGPSQSHAEMALAAIAQGKHVLVEIPLALSFDDASAVVKAAKAMNVKLGVVHPLRFRTEFQVLCARLASGEERVLQVHSRLYMHRRSNVGSTGLKRTWTDNLLWHHGSHLVDVSLWLAGAGDPNQVAASMKAIRSVVPPVDLETNVTMELAVLMETAQSQAILCSGSYNSPERIFDVMIVTDKDSYRLDILRGQMTTARGTVAVAGEEENVHLIAQDFLEAVRDDRAPMVTGESVLPAMEILQSIEDRQV